MTRSRHHHGAGFFIHPGTGLCQGLPGFVGLPGVVGLPLGVVRWLAAVVWPALSLAIDETYAP